MSEEKHLNPHTILNDPRVNGEFIDWRWGPRVPFCVKDYITSDLTDYEEIVKKGKIKINCKFYKPVSITHDSTFHHYSPEWNIKMKEEESGSSVNIRYTMKNFYIGNHGPFQNELRENRTKSN